jgi:hypothetical protein
MKNLSEIWSADTGNLVEVYASEEEALVAVLEIASENPDWARTLLLGRADESGEPEEVASGEALVHLARRRLRAAPR